MELWIWASILGVIAAVAIVIFIVSIARGKGSAEKIVSGVASILMLGATLVMLIMHVSDVRATEQQQRENLYKEQQAQEAIQRVLNDLQVRLVSAEYEWEHDDNVAKIFTIDFAGSDYYDVTYSVVILGDHGRFGSAEERVTVRIGYENFRGRIRIGPEELAEFVYGNSYTLRILPELETISRTIRGASSNFEFVHGNDPYVREQAYVGKLDFRYVLLPNDHESAGIWHHFRLEFNALGQYDVNFTAQLLENGTPRVSWDNEAHTRTVRPNSDNIASNWWLSPVGLQNRVFGQTYVFRVTADIVTETGFRSAFWDFDYVHMIEFR